LTTIDQSGRETGVASIRMLLKRINGRTEPKQFVVAPRLVTRRTGGPTRPVSVQQEPATTDVG
jgi:DNA-binding LacI/PurR family transcriptional regulator